MSLTLALVLALAADPAPVATSTAPLPPPLQRCLDDALTLETELEAAEAREAGLRRRLDLYRSPPPAPAVAPPEASAGLLPLVAVGASALAVGLVLGVVLGQQ